jgi:hypothetical protein
VLEHITIIELRSGTCAGVRAACAGGNGRKGEFATAVTVGIAYALGTILHEIEESDKRVADAARHN